MFTLTDLKFLSLKLMLYIKYIFESYILFIWIVVCVCWIPIQFDVFMFPVLVPCMAISNLFCVTLFPVLV